jgi:ABC-type nitrate/sulfonate/bicarbonate transport system ATPase subunit
MLEIRALRTAYDGHGRQVEALRDITLSVDEGQFVVRTVWHSSGVTLLFVTHDIDEAVYLGQRVVVLSSSPTYVLEDLAIDLPDKRDQLKTRSDTRFVDLRSHVYARIQQAKNPQRTERSS